MTIRVTRRSVSGMVLALVSLALGRYLAVPPTSSGAGAVDLPWESGEGLDTPDPRDRSHDLPARVRRRECVRLRAARPTCGG